MEIYLVGGAVRDQLLGFPVKERDWVVVGATPDTMLELGYTPVGKDFPVFLHPETKEEYALARTERKTAPGYTGFAFHADPDVTLEEDLRRRDLTVNAMAESADGELIDPFHGLADLQARIFRHVSPAFVEDPVRILRIARFMARFAGKGFNVAPETCQLMQAMVANGEVDALISERVWKEMVRALGEFYPIAFFDELMTCNALPRIFPELINAGNDDSARQSLRRAVNNTQDVQIRFAVFIYHLTDDAGINTLSKRLKIPTAFSDLAKLLHQHFEAFLEVSEMNAEDILTLLEKLDAFRRKERFMQFLQAADILGDDGPDHPHSTMLRRAYEVTMKIDAKALVAQGLKGKEIGAALRQQRVAAILRL